MPARLSPLIAIAAAVVVGSGEVAAQNPFPSAGAPPFDDRGGVQRPTWSDSCLHDFLPLREEAERRGKLIKAAADRHAPPDEACKLIGSFGEAERQMVEYVGAHSGACSIPAQVLDQLKNAHKSTEAQRSRVCAEALRMERGAPAGPAGDFDGPNAPIGSARGPS